MAACQCLQGAVHRAQTQRCRPRKNLQLWGLLPTSSSAPCPPCACSTLFPTLEVLPIKMVYDAQRLAAALDVKGTMHMRMTGLRVPILAVRGGLRRRSRSVQNPTALRPNTLPCLPPPVANIRGAGAAQGGRQQRAGDHVRGGAGAGHALPVAGARRSFSHEPFCQPPPRSYWDEHYSTRSFALMLPGRLAWLADWALRRCVAIASEGLLRLLARCGVAQWGQQHGI